MKKNCRIIVLALALLALCQTPALSQGAAKPMPQNDKYEVFSHYPTKILGVTGTTYGPGSTIYDINAKDGTPSNPRTPLYQSSGYKIPFVGITYAPYKGSNVLYGLSFSNMAYYASTLFRIGPDGAFNTLAVLPPTSLNGTEWRCGLEGDIAYDKSTGKLYATCSNGGWKLVTINQTSSVVTPVGSINAGGNYSALAVSPGGELYALDTMSRVLVKLNKTTGGVQGTPIPLTGPLPNTSTEGGMGFNDAGVLYAAFGGKLITINVTSGAVNVIGGTMNFSGLVVSGGGKVVIKKVF